MLKWTKEKYPTGYIDKPSDGYGFETVFRITKTNNINYNVFELEFKCKEYGYEKWETVGFFEKVQEAKRFAKQFIKELKLN
jgi:hypothetical protein